jgi:hypothetical protein
MQTRYRNLNLARKLHPDVMERLYLKDDSSLVPSSPSARMPASASLSGKEVGAMKSSKQKQETIPELPVRTNKEVLHVQVCYCRVCLVHCIIVMDNVAGSV